MRMLQGSFLLRSDVLLFCVVPEVLNTGPGQRDAGSRSIHGLTLHQSPPFLFQLCQYSHPGLVWEGLSWRISSHLREPERSIVDTKKPQTGYINGQMLGVSFPLRLFRRYWKLDIGKSPQR